MRKHVLDLRWSILIFLALLVGLGVAWGGDKNDEQWVRDLTVLNAKLAAECTVYVSLKHGYLSPEGLRRAEVTREEITECFSGKIREKKEVTK